ncbi:DNRLRE domain-containing protein [Paenibacillus sp. YN15]|uniref:CBM96 family carbohydrate-binding protein n=1 Tax=Paenibacillus sp. YN15 TaxID=1742774 RepID=UPI0011BDF23D|nr:DNRLRE domain-containing protein [Paenibacillus sp. YN15]
MTKKRNRIISILCIIAILFASFGFLVQEEAAFAASIDGRTTLNPAADAYIRGSEQYAGVNYGSNPVLEVRNQGFAEGNRLAYFKFDYNEVSEDIDAATLRLYAATIGQDATRTVSIYGTADKSWLESGIKWNNAPTNSTSLDANPAFTHVGDIAITNPTPGSVYRDHEHGGVGFWYEVDVTEYVQSQLHDKIVSFVVLIKNSADTNHVNFNSRENAGAKPELVIETSEGNPGGPAEPDAPAVYTPKEDTYVAGSNNTTPNPFYQENKLEVRHHMTGTNIRRSYIKFNFADFDKNIEKATLRLHAATIGATDRRIVEIGGVVNTWSANTVTWSGAGTAAPSAKNASTFIANLEIQNPTPGTQWTGGQWYEVDVTNYVKDRINDQEVSFVLWIRETSVNGEAANNQVIFHSAEAAEGKPQLVLTPRGDKYENENLPKTVSQNVYQFNSPDPLASKGSVNIVNMTGVGDYIEYSADVGESGVYSVKVNNKTDSDRGIYQLYIDGAAQGPQVDQYASSAAYTEEDLGMVAIEAAGVKIFRFEIAGQNDESSGYNLGLDYIRLQKAQLEKVSAVTANPPAGLLEAPTDVQLSTSTAGATIYYKIDAAPSWTEYTGPIHVDTAQKITAKAANPPFMYDSDIVEFNYRFPVNTDVSIKATTAGVSLDGIVDAQSGEWAGAELIKLEGTTDGTGVRTADVFMKYDYEMLYIGAKIKDPTPMVNAHTGSGIWNGDALEIFIGDEDLESSVYPPGGMAPSDRQIVLSGGTINGYQSYLNVGGVNSYPAMLMHIKPDADGKGYTMEAAIPLETLGFIKPWQNGGTKAIMNVVLSDGGFGGRGHWGWTTNGEQTKKSRGLWGKVAFEAAPDPADEIEATANVDSGTQAVTITGRTLHVQNKFVAMLVRDPSGNVSTFEQVRSDGNGYFTFHYQPDGSGAGSGVYSVLIGGEGISVPKETSFSLTDEEEETGNGFTIGQVQFTDFSGAAVTELTGSGFIMANITVTNDLNEPAQASMIVALYNANNTLQRIGTVEKNMTAGETAVMRAGFDLPANIANSRIKVFVWDSLEGMLPLSDVEVFPN